jgi:hypothetical protein
MELHRAKYSKISFVPRNSIVTVDAEPNGQEYEKEDDLGWEFHSVGCWFGA